MMLRGRVCGEGRGAGHLSRRRGRGLDNASKNILFALVVFLVIPISLLNGALVWLGLPKESNVTAGIAIFIYLIVVGVLVWMWVRLVVMPKRRAEEERKQQLQQQREQQEEERRRKRERQDEERRREREQQQQWREYHQEQRRRKREQQEEEARRKREQLEEERRRAEREREEQVEALLRRDVFRDSVNYMSGTEFEHFMADVFKKQGYVVETTPGSGDQGVDLLLTIDDRYIAVQLKRYSAKPVGNDAVQEVVAGMFHYRAKEAWVITTTSFTKKAVQLAKSTRVRLIDGRELEEWLSDLGRDV